MSLAAGIVSQRERHGIPQAVSCRVLGVSQACSISGAAVMSRRGGPAGRPGKGRWRCDTRVAGPKQVVQRRAGRHDAGTIHGPTSVTRCPSTVSL